MSRSAQHCYRFSVYLFPFYFVMFSPAYLSRLPCALTITSYLVCALVSLRIKPVAYMSVFLNLNLTCILSETCLFLSKPLLLKSIPVPCRCHAPSHSEPLALRAKVPPLTLHTKPSILRRADEPLTTSAIYDFVSYWPSAIKGHSRNTLERKQKMDANHPEGFLWPAERELMHHLVKIQEKGFAWEDSERGHFREDFFPPVDIPVIPHTPWV